MPFGDGTGPLGEGPRTGRGLGRCSSNNNENINNRGFFGRLFGRGFGRGRGKRGFGRGLRRGF